MRNFTLGLVAGSVALVISAIFRIIAGGLFIPELASQTLFSLTPGEVESFSVETFGSLAKYTAFIAAIVFNLVIYGALAILLHKLYIKLSNKAVIVNLIQLSFIPYLIMVAISAFLLQLNELLTRSSEIQYALLFLLLPSVVYGRTLSYLFQRGNIAKRVEPGKASNADIEGGGGEKKPDTTTTTTASGVRRISRRQFIAMGLSIVGVALFFSGPEASHSIASRQCQYPVRESPLPPTSANIPAGSIFAQETLAPFVASELTPNDKFYRIDTNIIVPSVDANSWRLNVRGLIKNGPQQFNYDELKAMPSTSEYATLECISDKIDGDLINTMHIGREFH